MINTGFRTYDIEADDFPITITVSTDASVLPDLAPVAFLFQDPDTGAVRGSIGLTLRFDSFFPSKP